ncbi:hypothetical protein [Pseudoduganella buxea]|uniref:Uncharacterized protein n=1 Tax=Pseudoduganella buxea TaxID=1949069 RepID=A0A6I3T3A9_9BURK|nr:hypothetical protein [Pseudoduganella buxea]MTV55196.1 hypothetical protein [Pseudoduganella buxea]GGC20663.1 hypothetical protein GCM10011572_47610 [Pseudoduganella buxea]
MGLILLPLLFAMLCGFGWLGASTGIRAASRAPACLGAVARLLGMGVALSSAIMLAAFGAVAHRAVPAGAFALILAVVAGGGLGLAGILWQGRFARLDKPADGVRAAACFLAAATFPVAWFTFAERLAGWFHVTWLY